MKERRGRRYRTSRLEKSAGTGGGGGGVRQAREREVAARSGEGSFIGEKEKRTVFL